MSAYREDSTKPRPPDSFLWDNCDHNWMALAGQFMVMPAQTVIDRLGDPPDETFTVDDQLLIEICRCARCGLYGAEVEVVTP